MAGLLPEQRLHLGKEACVMGKHAEGHSVRCMVWGLWTHTAHGSSNTVLGLRAPSSRKCVFPHSFILQHEVLSSSLNVCKVLVKGLWSSPYWEPCGDRSFDRHLLIWPWCPVDAHMLCASRLLLPPACARRFCGSSPFLPLA